MPKLAHLAAAAALMAGPALAQQGLPPVPPVAPRPPAAVQPVAPAAAKPAAPKPTVATETQQHPRIARAIRDLEDAIRYLEAAPHTFGGHKAKAIQDSRAAVVQLREALKYRAEQDGKPAAAAGAPKAPVAAAGVPAAPKAPATPPAQPSQFPRTPTAPNQQ